MDLFTDLAEKVSGSMTDKEMKGDVSIPLEETIQEEASSPAEVSTHIGDGKG